MVALPNDGLTTGCCNCNIKQNISNNRHSFTKIVKKTHLLASFASLGALGVGKTFTPGTW